MLEVCDNNNKSEIDPFLFIYDIFLWYLFGFRESVGKFWEKILWESKLHSSAKSRDLNVDVELRHLFGE